MGSYYLIGTELQFEKIKKVLRMDGSDGSTTWVYLMALNSIPKNGYNGKFLRFVYFTAIKIYYILHDLGWLYRKQKYKPFLYFSQMEGKERERRGKNGKNPLYSMLNVLINATELYALK